MRRRKRRGRRRRRRKRRRRERKNWRRIGKRVGSEGSIRGPCGIKNRQARPEKKRFLPLPYKPSIVSTLMNVGVT